MKIISSDKSCYIEVHDEDYKLLLYLLELYDTSGNLSGFDNPKVCIKTNQGTYELFLKEKDKK